jgi:hypothetical protein
VWLLHLTSGSSLTTCNCSCSLTAKLTLADVQRLVEQMRQGIEADMELQDQTGTPFTIPALGQFMLAPEDSDVDTAPESDELSLLLNETRNIIERYVDTCRSCIANKRITVDRLIA